VSISICLNLSPQAYFDTYLADGAEHFLT
jgi:hypothetical protein